MDDLIAFLRALLDEAEQDARAATPGPWRALEMYPDCYYVESEGGPHANVASESSSGDIDPENARHIARWDPAQVLADVEAKRTILAAFEEATQLSRRGGVPTALLPGLQLAVRALVAAHADHPDYRPEWAPDAEVSRG